MNIIEFAIKMELEGEKYYSEQAEINKGNSLSTVLLMLAKDEAMHAEIIQNKANKLPYDLKQTETLAEAKNVFSDIGVIKSEIKHFPDQLDVYRVALEKEKESITLYQKYLSEATDDESKKLFEYLIKQEEGHYAIIDQLVTLVSRPEEWVESAEFGLRADY
ncbi:MAG: ferritin family protein [Desulfosporosinus sp.]|nr:ferritin family protein [Desulfosporosinus sp.]